MKQRCNLIIRYSIALLLVGMLAACVGPQIYQKQLASLNKGMAPQEASAVLQQAPLATYTTSAQGTAYTFQRYALNNGRYADIYLLCYETRAQEQPRLKYWGYIDEFRRYPDAKLNQALESILPQLKAGSP